MTIIYEIRRRIEELMGFGNGWVLEYVGTNVNKIICDDDGRIRIMLDVTITLEPHQDENVNREFSSSEQDEEYYKRLGISVIPWNGQSSE